MSSKQFIPNKEIGEFYCRDLNCSCFICNPFSSCSCRGPRGACSNREKPSLLVQLTCPECGKIIVRAEPPVKGYCSETGKNVILVPLNQLKTCGLPGCTTPCTQVNHE